MLAIVCPGQGSQTPGFLTPWLELPGQRDLLAELSEWAQVDLIAHGTTSDADTIRDTAVAQPLIVAAGLMGLRALYDGAAPLAGVALMAGHSVGEITAAAASGALNTQSAMEFVGLRGREMAAASAVQETGMTAVVGGDAAEVAATLAEHGLTPANMNGAGQVVAAGTREQLDALAAQPPAKARVIPLSVAGAFHTEHMQPAVQALRAFASSLHRSNPTVPLVSNTEGAITSDGGEVLSRLVNQVANPVRWDLCMQTLVSSGVTALIELPPAGTLTGLAKRAMPGVTAVAVKTPDDLDKARELIAQAVSASQGV